jgi:hypothetical protein
LDIAERFQLDREVERVTLELAIDDGRVPKWQTLRAGDFSIVHFELVHDLHLTHRIRQFRDPRTGDVGADFSRIL